MTASIPLDELFVLGVDGGGTHTVGVIVDGHGREAGRAQTGPCNHQSIGVEPARRALAEAIGLARRAAGDPPLAAACLGMAGLDRDEDRRVIRAMAAPLLAGVPFEIVLDAEVALAAATGGRRVGLVIIAGTGSIAVGFDEGGRRARAGGWGHLLGDEGSGYDLARRGLTAAARAADGRGPRTSLIEALVAAAGADTFEALTNRIYIDGWTVGQVAALAPVVLAQAEAGDEVALAIVAGAARELGLAAGSVMAALGLGDRAFDVVLSGGLLAGNPGFADRLRQEVRAGAPRAVFALPDREPAYGAALIALNAARQAHSQSTAVKG